ncbi:Gfo/Idh/MocA family protein [Brachybacterium sp.]|uniref:Gfo/Idh/MocA family protein n=1 Tax=Brachybacterium sp. TaxID=1891286 RepID=UPI003F937048
MKDDTTRPALRWLLAGASDIAATRMVAAIRAQGGTVEGVVSGSAQRAREFASDLDIPVGTTSLEEGLNLGVDAVYISSTNDKHQDQAMAAIGAGKHVLCEKPLALTVAGAEEMVEAATRRGVVLAANHHLPGSPLHAAVRDLVSAGRIGRLVAVRVMHAVELPRRLQGWRVDVPAELGGGVIMDITCHDASVLNRLFGRLPSRVTAVGARQSGAADGPADAAMVVLEYPDGAGGTVLAQTHDAFTVPHDTTRLEAYGTEGSIIVRDAMTQDIAGTVELVTAQGAETIDVDCSSGLYEIVIESFASAIAGDGLPTADGQAGVDSLRVALAAHRSTLENCGIDPAELL